jgi:hypothetical protein
VGAIGLYARVTPEELDRALKDPEFEQHLEETLFDTKDHRVWNIDKTWDALSYLLIMAKAPIDIIRGGTGISDYQWCNDGPARYFTTDQVKEMAAYLQATPWQHFASHYDPAAMTAAGIYGWDAKSLDWLQAELEGLGKFFAETASAGDAIITIIG